MIDDFSEKRSVISSSQDQMSQSGDTGKGFMEIEGRGLSDLLRNSTEGILLNSVIDSPALFSAPSLDMLGFKNFSQPFREDSENLFNSWLMNAEIPGFNTIHTRQASRRLSKEFPAPSGQQNGSAQKKNNDDNLPEQNFGTSDDYLIDLDQHSLRSAAEKGLQASELFLAKAWFHSSQPMTRSRSSELRRRYAAMQGIQIPAPAENPNNNQEQVTNGMNQEFPSTSNPCDNSMDDMCNQMQAFISPSNSSTSPFDTPITTVDKVSSVVTMLKGTLEQKKLGYRADKEASQSSSLGFYTAKQIQPNMSSDQDPDCSTLGASDTFQLMSFVQVQNSMSLAKVERSVEQYTESVVTQPNHILMGIIQPSQSGSCTAAPALSASFEVCGDPTESGQAISICESAKKYAGNGTSDYGSKTREYGEKVSKDSLTYDRKKGNLARVGSISSGCSVDIGDPTKKRRVERSRKMAEAKERNLTPSLSSDMQAVLKRCENLEKEVRSLKLTLSFMNRKDSEQTKQIEDLQKQNEELTDEKERLLEEIERIMTES
ncbi:protein CYCLOPS-like [Typha latifolia]|uniref:protein CYCLOPS-like n=1 Tax=Typha latifolia TaxID=4733 RepID=UPI003C2B0E35